jgi:hypothetical protein
VCTWISRTRIMRAAFRLALKTSSQKSFGQRRRNMVANFHDGPVGVLNLTRKSCTGYPRRALSTTPSCRLGKPLVSCLIYPALFPKALSTFVYVWRVSARNLARFVSVMTRNVWLLQTTIHRITAASVLLDIPLSHLLQI